MATATLDRLRDHLRDQAQDAQAQYRQLVLNVADDLDIAPEEVLGILRRAGRDPDELDDDVAIENATGNAQRYVDDVAPAAEEVATITAKIKAADAELLQAQQRHTAAINALARPLEAARTRVTIGHNAQQEVQRLAV